MDVKNELKFIIQRLCTKVYIVLLWKPPISFFHYVNYVFMHSEFIHNAGGKFENPLIILIQLYINRSYNDALSHYLKCYEKFSINFLFK